MFDKELWRMHISTQESSDVDCQDEQERCEKPVEVHQVSVRSLAEM